VHSRLRRITDWSRRAMLARYRVKELASLCGVSPRHLQRFIRQTEGCCPQQWLNRLKLEFAAGAILKDQTPVKEVAAEFGYSDTAHFSRAFRRYHGVPPSEAGGHE
jgi:iron complex transport system substrate-binding protein